MPAKNSAKFSALLKERGLSSTRGRLAILEALQNYPLLPAPELEAIVATKIHRSNLYRNLDLLVEKRIIKVVPRGFKSLYELGEDSQVHHHHFVCDICGHSKDITDWESLGNALRDLEYKLNVKLISHEIDLAGICSKCIGSNAVKPI